MVPVVGSVTNVIGSLTPALSAVGCIQNSAPDFEKLGRLLKLAKGENRTMAEFAAECDTSPSAFSRIMTGNLKRPLAYETLDKIASASEGRVGLIELVEANGNQLYYPSPTPKLNDNDETEKAICSVLVESLLDRGLAVRRIRSLDNVSKSFSFKGKSNMTLCIEGNEKKIWFFDILTEEGLSSTPPSNGINGKTKAELLAGNMFHHVAEIFLADAWGEIAVRNIQFSFVFTDAEVLAAFSRRVSHAKVENCFSLILVALDEGEVLSEQFLTRKDGTVQSSIFEKTVTTEVFYDEYFL